jgi:valyl-tRNA synthetase
MVDNICLVFGLHRNAEQALQAAAAKFNTDAANIELEQDPDVLDTWFSSGSPCQQTYTILVDAHARAHTHTAKLITSL